jgi:hypothetical protein
MIRVMTSYGFRVYLTRRAFERGQQRAALAGVLTVLLPLVVILASGALANGRLPFHSPA